MRRVDGHKFQAEFEKAMLNARYYVHRLPTLNTGYSGLTQPADFLVLKKNAMYIELKETGNDTFSIAQMPQLDEIKNFTEWKINTPEATTGYLIIVHYIKRQTLKVITNFEALNLLENRQTLKYDSDIGQTFKTLVDIAQGDLI